MGANPYVGQAGGGDTFYSAYQNYLGRNPAESEVAYWGSQPGTIESKVSAIQNSPEALTYGRARNEVNPQIDAEQQQVRRDLELAYQRGGSELEALRPYYEAQLGQLNFGWEEQENAIAQAIRELEQTQGMQSQRLTESYQPALLNARNVSNRAGFGGNSTITADRIAAGFKPISQALADLAFSTQQKMAGYTDQRQSIAKKYQFSTENLVSQREQQAKAIKDQLALITQQAGNQQSELESRRNPSIYARSGELFDTNRQFDLMLQQLAEQRRQFDLNLQLQREAANKL